MDASVLGEDAFGEDAGPPDDGGVSSSNGPAGHLWIRTDDSIWDLGPADLDTDADGVEDSLTRTGGEGMAVYTDSDGDGEVDRITEIDQEGRFTARHRNPDTGQWDPTDSGRLA